MNRRLRAPSRGIGWFFRWFLILLVASSFVMFTALFTALPGFGYRTPRVADGDFREAGPETPVLPKPGEGPSEAPRPRVAETARAVAVTLYYPTADHPYRIAAHETIVEEAEDLGSLLAGVIRHLTHPPEATGLLPALPAGTRLLTHFRDGDLLLVNLSPAFQDPVPGGLVSSHATLYAMVNTLTSLPEIERVRFLVSNQEALTFRGAHALDGEFRFFPGAVRVLEPPPPEAAP